MPAAAQKDRGGAYALRQAVRYLKDGYSIVMTADVPPGPARRAGIGIVMMARLSGRPIVPCAAATSRFRALNTWSRMTINLPGSKLAYVAGDPIWVPPDAGEAELEFARLQLERGAERRRPRAPTRSSAPTSSAQRRRTSKTRRRRPPIPTSASRPTAPA